MKYDVVVGLETHAELKTKTKIYCSCKNSFGAEVNTQCCPICMGLPGTLTRLNKTVVDYAVKMGLATGCTINNVSKQDRKNYLYPDNPKSYQITQDNIPLCENGAVTFMHQGQKAKVRIHRIHIEEDAGKLIHHESFKGSLVDFNRCGVPLIEIVSEPDITSAAMAKEYLEALRSILQYIDVSDCKMQEGSIRCDVNVSVKPAGSDKLGTRVEMKNVNTFSGTERAIEYEVNRQIALLEIGQEIEQETRRWDDEKGISVLMRSKEDAQDYRYFPEPDLKTVYISKERIEELRKEIPELPNVKIERYMSEYGMSQVDATVIAENMSKSKFFEDCIAIGGVKPKNIANRILTNISMTLNERNCEIDQLALTPQNLVKLVKLIEDKTISASAAQTVLEVLIDKDVDPAEVVKEKGLAQISDASALEEIVNTVLANNQKAVQDYKNGKTNVIGFLVGQCMRASKGSGNPGMLQKMIVEKIQ